MSKKKDPLLRETILDAALEVLAKGPCEHLGIDDLLEATGISRTSVLTQFDTVTDVLLAAMERASDEMNQARREAIEGFSDPVVQLRTLIEMGIPDQVSPAIVMMYTAVGLIRVDPATIKRGRQHIDHQVALYRPIIESGIEQKLFIPNDHPESIAANFVALEDAFDFYLVLGIDPDGARGRAQVYRYAEAALSFDLIGPLRKRSSVVGPQEDFGDSLRGA